MKTSFNTYRGPSLLAVLLLVTAACDSGGDDVAFTDVAGTYAFTQFVFDPTTPALQNVIVLDTLVSATTRLRLFEDGQYALEFQFREGPLSVANGRFSVDTRRVRLTSDRDDRDRLKAMLLDSEVTLDRAAAGQTMLTATIEKTVNMEAFSSKYVGLTAIPGTLMVRLARQ